MKCKDSSHLSREGSATSLTENTLYPSQRRVGLDQGKKNLVYHDWRKWTLTLIHSKAMNFESTYRKQEDTHQGEEVCWNWSTRDQTLKNFLTGQTDFKVGSSVARPIASTDRESGEIGTTRAARPDSWTEWPPPMAQTTRSCNGTGQDKTRWKITSRNTQWAWEKLTYLQKVQHKGGAKLAISVWATCPTTSRETEKGHTWDLVVWTADVLKTVLKRLIDRDHQSNILQPSTLPDRPVPPWRSQKTIIIPSLYWDEEVPFRKPTCCQCSRNIIAFYIHTFVKCVWTYIMTNFSVIRS